MPRPRSPAPLRAPGLAWPALVLVALVGSPTIAEGGPPAATNEAAGEEAAADAETSPTPDATTTQLAGTWIDTAAEEPEIGRAHV